MPSKPPMPLAEARRKIDDMLEALSSTNSPGFSCHAIDRSIRVISAERINQDGRFATDEEVSKWKFFGRVKFRMQCTENMANQMGNMHGGCVATIVDNLTSMAVNRRCHEKAERFVTDQPEDPCPTFWLKNRIFRRSTCTLPTSRQQRPGPSSE